MKVRVLGAHNCESNRTKFATILIDDIIAVDAGAITSCLSFRSQLKLKAVLLTHQHYDHIKDIPALGMNLLLRHATVNIYSTQVVYEALTRYLLDGKLYPNFLERPPDNPTFKFTVMEPGQSKRFAGYRLRAVAVSHAVPTVGYEVTSPDGSTIFYTGDTGSGLADCWRRISPQVLFIEVTAPNRREQSARASKHLTPNMLRDELVTFREMKGYLPRVVVLHMNPDSEAEIKDEIAGIAAELNGSITLGYEGMQLQRKPK
ncbi:MAG: MBL fold metallo-hydrolase [Chloroflexota bacterium]